MRLLPLAVATLLLTAIGFGTAQAAVGGKLDRTQLGSLSFNDPFTSAPTIDVGCSSKTARYVDQFCGEGATNSMYPRTHGEHECYSDPVFDGILPFTQFSAAGGIQINAARHLFVVPACSGALYSSGMLSTINSFSMKHGYWEITAQMPKGGQGRWPAIWLMPQAGGWPPEIDIVEMAQGVWFGTQHSTANHNGVAASAPALGCLCDKPHIFGLLNTGTKVVWYVDNVEIAEQPMMAGNDVPYYLIINLAIYGGSWQGAETATSAPAAMGVTAIRAYALK
jgi:hypothetical protein